MELRHLRYFVAVAEELGFARAARRLRVAQPALSKQTRDLEAELGVALFERLPRGVRLTRAGEAFLTEARKTLDGAVRAIATARGASESRATTLHFAHGELSLYAATIESLLATFRAAYPEVHVRGSSQTDGESYRALRDRTVDVACVFLAPRSLSPASAREKHTRRRPCGRRRVCFSRALAGQASGRTAWSTAPRRE